MSAVRFAPKRRAMLRAKLFLIALTIGCFVPLYLIDAAPIKLKASYLTVGSGYAALWVTKEAKIFERNGLDVEPVYIPPTLLTAAMIAGEAPIGMSGVGTPIEATLRGADFVSLCSTVKAGGPVFLVTRREITKPEQLKRKKLGISRFGSTTDTVLRVALRSLGVDVEKDVTVLQVGNSAARVTSLIAGNIDGTLVTVEQAYAAKQQGMNVLADVRTLGVEYPFADVVSTRGFVTKNEDIVRRFVKAIVEGIHFYKTNKEKSIDVMAKYMRLDDRRIVEIGYEDLREAYQRKPYPTVKGIELALEELAGRNPNAKNARPEQFYDARFVKELDESGFIDNLYK